MENAEKQLDRTNETVKDSGEYLYPVLDVTGDAVFIFDLKDGVVIEANERAERLCGHPRETLIGTSIGTLSSGEHPYTAKEALKLAFRSRSGKRQVIRWQVKHGSGKIYPIEARIRTERINGRNFVVAGLQNVQARQPAPDKNLRANDGFLGTLLDSVQDGVSVLDKNLNIMQVNDRMDSAFPDHMPLVGKKCYEVYHHRDSICDSCPSVVAMSTGLTQRAEMASCKASDDDGARWINLSAFPFKDEAGEVTGVIEYIEDITDRKLSECELRESQQRLNSHIKSTPLGAIEWDENRRIIEWNLAAEKIFGYSREEAIGQSTDLLLRSEDQEQVDSVMEALFTQQGGLRSTNPNLTKGGRVILCDWYNSVLTDAAGNVTGVASLVMDITESNAQLTALEKLVKISSQKKEDGYIEAMTLALREVSHATYTLIGRRTSSGKHIRTLAVAKGNELIDNFEYPLAGAPCEKVVDREICIHPSDVTTTFPDDQLLAEKGIEAYIGIPLFNDRHECVGILVSLYDHPLDNTAAIQSLFELYAINIGAKMQQTQDAKQLAESEAKQRMLFENMTSAFMLEELVFDRMGVAIDSRCLQVNPAFETLTGLRAREVFGKPVSEILPSDKELWIENFKKVGDTGKPVSFEQHSSELGKHYDVSIFPAGQENQCAILFNDISDQKTAALELEQSQQLLSSIINTIPVRVFWKDLESVFIGGNTAYVGDVCIDSPEALKGKTDFEVSRDPLQAEAFRADDRVVMKSGVPKIGYEERKKQVDGSDHWLKTSKIPLKDLQGEIFGVLGLYEDITERKEAENKLLRLSTAIEQSPEAVIMTDLQGIIQYVNPSFETITGYTREEAVGQNPSFLSSGDQDKEFYSHLWETIQAGKTWEGRLINKRKDGTRYTEEATISPAKDAEGEVTNYVAVKRDITNELNRDEELRKGQKMEAVGQLASGIAHDFNNILQAILGFSEILMMQLEKDTLEHKNVKEIHLSAKRAAELTKQLLAFSRKQPAEQIAINITEVVDEMNGLLDVLLGEKYTIAMELEKDIHPVVTDPGQVNQIVMNLAVNARDAMPDGGGLTIKSENVSINKEDVAVMPNARTGDFVCLSVKDTGSGMDKKTKDRLFEPFFTTKEVGKGTGLGLSVVYGIIKQSKGWINVYSEIGEGTCFKIYLPVQSASFDPNADLAAVSGGNPETNAATILYVEDEDDVREMVVKILETVGYRPVALSNAEEALELFKQDENRFDMLLSDVVLPNKDGIEFAGLLRDSRPELPVLIYSGHRDQRERWKNLGEKDYHFTPKPFTVPGLLAVVHDTLNNNSKK